MYQYYYPMPMDMSRDADRDIRTVRLAEVYVPDQPYIGLLPLEEALKRGTIFPNLVKPLPLYKKP